MLSSLFSFLSPFHRWAQGDFFASLSLCLNRFLVCFFSSLLDVFRILSFFYIVVDVRRSHRWTWLIWMYLLLDERLIMIVDRFLLFFTDWFLIWFVILFLTFHMHALFSLSFSMGLYSLRYLSGFIQANRLYSLENCECITKKEIALIVRKNLVKYISNKQQPSLMVSIWNIHSGTRRRLHGL